MASQLLCEMMTIKHAAVPWAARVLKEFSPMTTKSTLVVLLSGASVMFSAGCTTKTYVRQQTQPIIDKTNTLDDLTAKNTRDIRDVDTRAQQGIQGVNQKATEADQKAGDARTRADQAQTLATQASGRVEALSTQVANLDNYHPVVETSVHFAFNKADLTPKAKEALDQLLAEVANTKGYLVVVEGGTDSVGSANYNYKLSERRAEAVVQYLSEKSVPAHKIYVIGLGKDKTVAPNQTAEGRAQNRRVDVRLMTNNTASNGQTSAQSTAPNPSR
jgi:OmpA-OmpF porin, OOP family